MEIEHFRTWIGRDHEVEDVVTPRLVRQFSATFHPHAFEGPTSDGQPAPAPVGLHWCLAPDAEPMTGLGPDGHAAKGAFLPPVPLPRRMWAGGEVETLAPLVLGDTVRRRSIVEDVVAKAGRSGPLVFVTVRHELSTARHGLALRERHDIVYREASPSGLQPSSATAPAADRPADLSWTIDPSPVLLFRYSALTFNGHRIHYDAPYVTGVEGYAGLVVHGPLQATLCLALAATLIGAPPRRFGFRNVAPLVAGPAFRVSGARRADGGLDLWTCGADGRVRMTGDAEP